VVAAGQIAGEFGSADPAIASLGRQVRQVRQTSER
jgi:hypothetical protein